MISYGWHGYFVSTLQIRHFIQSKICTLPLCSVLQYYHMCKAPLGCGEPGGQHGFVAHKSPATVILACQQETKCLQNLFKTFTMKNE